MTDSLKAFAKINLYLRVLNRRDDGYHNILSLMAHAGLYDLLKLEKIEVRYVPGGDTEIKIRITGGCSEEMRSVPGQENLISKAALKYFRTAGVSGRAEFSLEKNIPLGAGLGGGSADAAAALKLLNETAGLMNAQELFALGSTVGADVPFCLTGGFAICEGTGNVVLPVISKLKCAVLILNNGIQIETAGAYRALRRNSQSIMDIGEILSVKDTMRSALEAGDLRSLAEIHINDFEKPAFRKHPEILDIKHALTGAGADFSAMTGSGSSVIGLFENREKAMKAEREFSKKIKYVILTDFI